MGQLFGLFAILFAGFITDSGSSYMPPPADDILGYYYFDNSSYLRVKKNTNIFDNSRKRRNYFPSIYGDTITSLYASPFQSDTLVYEYTIICLTGYLCTSRDNFIYHKKAVITEVQLKHKSVIGSVNIFNFLFLGIPYNALPESIKIEYEFEKNKINK